MCGAVWPPAIGSIATRPEGWKLAPNPGSARRHMLCRIVSVLSCGMRYARIGKSLRDVDATDAAQRADYLCPSCGGRVFLRDGYVRDAHFAHYPGAGSDQCEEYHPGASAGLEAATVAAVEDGPDELGLCVQFARDALDDWSIVLRIPEMTVAELAGASLATLQQGALEVFADGARVQRLAALDVRPGVGVAAAVVPPNAGHYRVATVGRWPNSIDLSRWNAEARGLALVGTLFRRRRGEWTRLRPRSIVHWGEALLLLADRRCQPPRDCGVARDATLGSVRGSWQAWRITLPSRPSEAVEDWLDRLGHLALPPASELKLLSVPRSFSDSGRTPQFYRGDAVLAKITAPAGEATEALTIFAGSDARTVSVGLTGTPRAALLSAETTTVNAGRFHVALGHEATTDFEIIEPPQLDDLRGQVASLPHVRLWVGGRCLEPWRHEAQRVYREGPRASVEVRIESGVEEGRVRLVVGARGNRRVWASLTTSEAERVLTEALAENSDVSIEIDAGGLGRVAAIVKDALVEDHERAPASRVVAWLAQAATGRAPAPHPLGPFVARRMRSIPALRRTATVGLDPAFATQLRAIARGVRSPKGRGR